MLFPFKLAKLESKSDIYREIGSKFQSYTLNNLDEVGLFSNNNDFSFEKSKFKFGSKKDTFPNFPKSSSLNGNFSFFENEEEYSNDFETDDFSVEDEIKVEKDFDFGTELDLKKQKEFQKKKTNDTMKNISIEEMKKHFEDCEIKIRPLRVPENKQKKIKKINSTTLQIIKKTSISSDSQNSGDSKKNVIVKNPKNLYKEKQRINSKVQKIKSFWDKSNFISIKVFKISQIVNDAGLYVEEYLDLSGKLFGNKL